MTVVSNTTPLIALAGIGQLDTLRVLYGQIRIPPEVFAEYQAGLQVPPGFPSLDSVAWIVVQSAPMPSLVPTSLDPGEAAAISLALAIQAELVLIDEQDGRAAARQLGLAVSGSLGALIDAKKRGHLPLIRPYVDQMIAQGRYISPRLRRRVLALAGE
jgi:predicted nucleic acid-binding protein